METDLFRGEKGAIEYGIIDEYGKSGTKGNGTVYAKCNSRERESTGRGVFWFIIRGRRLYADQAVFWE